MDGITLGFKKDLIPELQDDVQHSDPPVIKSGSRHHQRAIIKDEATRATQRRFAGVGKALSLQQCREMTSSGKTLPNLVKLFRNGQRKMSLLQRLPGEYKGDLKKMVPKPYTIRRTTRSSLSTGKHALTVPVSRTHATGRTFIHTAVDIWNSLPDNVVGRITDNNLQSFKTRVHRHLLSTARTSACS
ncbi:hypothetical protein Bbelb_192830 [Branchiostoma belcheri]|nr:hypothetical protein Bbelb_192830 [Branchiostoma belcheri]